MDRRDADDSIHRKFHGAVSRYDIDMESIFSRLEIAQKTSPVGNLHLQVLVARNANDVFPVDKDRTHGVRAVAQSAELQALMTRFHQ